ncbi:unnamed protein product [Clonostachys rosea]|uniref:Transcription factor domain-containing protein n=1 Tax=Bionectria ochroleuca TaxID=29856 RepID=A0ABY6UPX2_BIOOC|nr:unnamed protein product [Clonostachys rosea]
MGNNRPRRQKVTGDGSEPSPNRESSPTLSAVSWEEGLSDWSLTNWADLVVDQFFHEDSVNKHSNKFNLLTSPTFSTCVLSPSPAESTSPTGSTVDNSMPDSTSTDSDITTAEDNQSALWTVTDKPTVLCVPSLGDFFNLPVMTGEDIGLFRYCRPNRSLPFTGVTGLTIASLDVAHMCPRCVVRNGFNNNYRQVVLPLADKSDILLKAILAVTANRMRLQDARFQTIALRHQAAVLQGLQRALRISKRTCFSRLEILGTILMLCFYEIYSPALRPVDACGAPSRAWKSHSVGVRKVLEQGSSEKHDSRYETAIVSFFSQYFASRCVLTYTALSPTEDQDELIDNAQYWLKLVDRPASEINPFSGCSNEMLRIILIITSRLRQLGQSNLKCPPKSEQLWADMMLEKLVTIEQHMPDSSSDDTKDHHSAAVGTSDTHPTTLKIWCEAFRLAALIMLGNFYPQTDLAAQQRRHEYLCQFGDILKSGISLPDDGKLGSSSYAWPCLIAGSHLPPPNEYTSLKSQINDIFSHAQLESPTSDTMSGRIRSVLEATWSRRNGLDGNASIIVRYDGADVFLWEKALLHDRQILEWV